MTKNRLFVKMVITYFCILLSTLTMLGVLLSFLLNNYLIFNKQTEMLVRATDISKMVKPYLVSRESPIQLVSLLNRADKNLGTEIWVIDSRGYVIAASADQKVHEGDMIEDSELTDMRAGRVSVRQGKSKVYHETVLWVIVPVEDDSRVIGGIIVYAPIIGITQTTDKVRNLFLYSAVVSILFSTVVVYLLSKYVTGPLQQMNRVAKQLACGNLTERVRVRQGDEIGDLAEAFNHMASQIEKQEMMRRNFVADVSHELRSPLTNIQGFIEAMIDGKDKTEEDRFRYLGIIHKETTRLARLVNELLDLSRLESGTGGTIREPVSAPEIIRSAVAKTRPAFMEKGIMITLDITDGDVLVWGTSDRLEQVIINLLDNACRYSPQGGEIHVRLAVEDGKAQITVRDYGSGIPAGELPLIWERFYKVDKARSREGSGTGLGLAIVRQIIESLGGQVLAGSELGKGSEIGFIIPVCTPDKTV